MRVTWIAVLGMLPLAACTDEPNIDFSMEDDTTFAGAEVNYAPDDQFAVLTDDGVVKLGLTSNRVYFEVSEAVRDRIDDEIASGMKESDSRIARSISGAVRRGVGSALSIDIDYRLDEIREVRYEGGQLVFDFVDSDRTLDNIEIDNEPITRAFSDEDARAFATAFARVKAGESIRDDAAIAKQPDSVQEKRPTDRDSAGGASF